MSDEKKTIKDKVPFWSKLKKIKGIEYIVIGIVCLLVFIIYFSSVSNENATTSKLQNTSGLNYADELENKLSKVLSNVQGAGNVSVMVTLASSGEIVIATSTEERTNTSSGTSNSTQSNTKVETPVIIDDQPLIVKEYLPEIKGIIIVAQGASSIKVKLELLKAVQTLIDIDSNKIEILVGK